MAANQDNREIVQAIIQLASTMNMWTLAEGVETRQDLDFLAQFGCEYAQGFYFTKPMDESTTKQYLSKYFDRTIDLN
jgi:EAL domain-containing protein (putative c-di-GMP-specific phosphodiesterase class I)